MAMVCSDAGSWRTCLVVLPLRRGLRPSQRSLACAALPIPEQQQSPHNCIISLYSIEYDAVKCLSHNLVEIT